MAVTLSITRIGGSTYTVDLPASSDKCPVSYKYSLESDDLSAYTSAYSTTLKLPRTHRNNLAFNFPDQAGYGAVSTVDTFTYTFTVDSFTDSGKVVVASVDDEYININLFSSLAAFNSALSEATWPTSGAYKNEDDEDSDITYDSNFQPVKMDNLFGGCKFEHTTYWNTTGLSSEDFHFNDTSGNYCDLMWMGMADIGLPNDQVSDIGTLGLTDNLWCTLADTETKSDFTWIQAPGVHMTDTTTSAWQIRWYWLRFFIPINVLIYNTVIDDFTLSLSTKAKARLRPYVYIGPKMGDLKSTDGTPISQYYWDVDEHTGHNARFGQFYINDILSQIETPYEIIKRVCKMLNLRWIRVSDSEYQICTCEEYYGTTSIHDISDDIDYSNYTTTPHSFSYSNIIFEGEAIGSTDLQAYKDKTGYEFNRGNYTTGYPISKEKQWFSDSYKYISSYPHTFKAYPWNESVDLSYTKDMLVSYDDSLTEVDCSGCIIRADVTSPMVACMTGDVSANVSYYDPWNGYYDNTISNAYVVRHWLSLCDDLLVAAVKCSNDVYGEPAYKIQGQETTNIYSQWFKDVNDSLTSSLVTTNVMFDSSYASIDDVTRKIYWFDNNYWCIWSIDSFIPGGKDPSEVTFLKINDINNYLEPVDTFTNSISIDHGTVTVTVNGVSVTPSSFTTNYSDKIEASFTASSGYHIISYTEDGTTYPLVPAQSVTCSYTSLRNKTLSVSTHSIYTVTASVSGSGGSVDPTSVSADPGSSVTLVATPDTDYRVLKWVDNGTTYTTTDTEYTIEDVQASHTVVVHFVSDVCQLTGQVYDSSSSTTGVGGTISTDGQTYSSTINVSGHYGDTVTIYQRPASNYRFDHWETTSGTYISAESTLTYTLTASAASIRCCFWNTSTSSYSLVTTSGEGIGNTTGFGQYAAGASVTVGCELLDGYSFDGWYSGDTKMSSSQSYTFTMPSSNLTLQARGSSSSKIILNFKANNGTVSPTRAELNAGETVSVSVSPSSGYSFLQWNDGDTSNPRTFTAVSSMTYTAVCALPQEYTYLFQATTGGSVSESSWTASAGSTKTVTATATDASYDFVMWDDGDTTASRTFTMGIISRTYTAMFKKVRSTLTITSNGHCTISPTTVSGTIGSESSEVTITPDTHYYISGNDYDGSSESPHKFVFGDFDETVTYEINQDPQWTLTFSSNNTSLGTVSTESYTGYTNDTVTVTASPTASYNIFSQWSDGDHTNPRTFTVGSMDKSYQAVFYRLDTYHVSLTCAQSGVTLTGDGDYLAGASVTVKCEDYTGSFLGWQNVHTGTYVAYTSEYSFTMPSSNLDLVAVIS